MKKYFFLLSIFMLTVIGCQQSGTHRQLALVDTLLMRDQVDSAAVELRKIDSTAVEQEDTPYYNLLRVETQFRQRLPVPFDTILTVSIDHYKETGDYEKLARAYFCKSAILYGLKKNEDAVLAAKMAEEAAEHTDNNVIKVRVNGMLSCLNAFAGNNRLALHHSRQTLIYALREGRERWIGYAYDNLSTVFSYMGMNDSSHVYERKFFPYLKYQPRADQPIYLDNMATYYIDHDRLDKALECVRQSLAIKPMARTYGLMAQIYDKSGKDWQVVQQMWDGAMKNEDLEDRIFYMKEYMKWLQQQERHREAAAMSIRIDSLNKMLHRQQQAEHIHGIQAAYDKDQSMGRLSCILAWAAAAALVLTLTVLALWLYHRQKMGRAQRELADTQRQIAGYEQRIAEMEASGRERERETKELRRKLEELRTRHVQILAAGKQLYDQITGGGTARAWHKAEFEQFVEYYTTIDLPFVTDMETHYKPLSPLNKMLLILPRLDIAEEDVQTILGMSSGAIRTMRSRLKRKTGEE